MTDNPQPPLTELAAEAALHHEMFNAWTEAGFTEGQAIKLLAAIVTANATGGAK